MISIPYPQFKENLFYEKLDNGLDVYIWPKVGFQKTYATLSTRYGSIDQHFQLEGHEEMTLPEGIAHFLEHKMFEKEEGDVFNRFAAHGASANAYTSYDRTAYVFSATQEMTTHIITLLDFVQNPHFTDAGVDKEIGIIRQEIQMYQDQPDWRNYTQLLQAMYRFHPIRSDILGTAASIEQITKDHLYACYETFYQPHNMMLFIVGGVDPYEMMTVIHNNQKHKHVPKPKSIRRFVTEEPLEINIRQQIIHLPVSTHKCLFGFKESAPNITGNALLRYELTTHLVLDICFSASSPIYRDLYDEQQITDRFGYEFQCSTEYAFSVIGGDSPQPEVMMKRIEELLIPLIQQGIDVESFERARKKKMGHFLRMMNSPEAIAHEFTKYRFKGIDLMDMYAIYEQITLEEMNQRLREHMIWSQMAISIVQQPEVL